MTEQGQQQDAIRTDAIVIDDVALGLEYGTPMTNEGKLAVRPLAGIDFEITVTGQQATEVIEGLTKRSEVDVRDPFANRAYRATMRLRQSSYQEGQPRRHYRFEVRELDTPPEVRLLEINGQQFTVLAYTESAGDNGPSRQAVLRLTPDELSRLRQVIAEGKPLQVRRVDVDEQPFTARFGRYNYWSRHEEDGQEYYKQLIRLYPIGEVKSKLKLDFAQGIPQDNLIEIVKGLSARFDLLLNALVEEGAITAERRDHLLGADWRDAVGPKRASELDWQTNAVRDAIAQID